MNPFVISSLLPVVVLIAAGYLAGRRRWIGGNAVKDLSNLIFLLLAPALLFRAMSTVHVQELSLKQFADTGDIMSRDADIRVRKKTM